MYGGGTVLQRQLVSDSTLGNWAVALVLRSTWFNKHHELMGTFSGATRLQQGPLERSGSSARHPHCAKGTAGLTEVS